MKWVVRRMVRSLLREVSRSHMPRRASGSIPEVGSSSITTWVEKWMDIGYPGWEGGCQSERIDNVRMLMVGL